MVNEGIASGKSNAVKGSIIEIKLRSLHDLNNQLLNTLSQMDECMMKFDAGRCRDESKGIAAIENSANHVEAFDCVVSTAEGNVGYATELLEKVKDIF